jgi:hypothetical protein
MIYTNQRIERVIANAARKQSNLYVSDLYLRGALKVKAKKKEFSFPFFHSLVKLYCVKQITQERQRKPLKS